jgi:hypothetical protein
MIPPLDGGAVSVMGGGGWVYTTGKLCVTDGNP